MKATADLNTPYGYLSKYRSELMGVAILLVIWFHTDFSFELVTSPVVRNTLHYFKELGYGGVDLFFLISGFGIWHSLQKNKVPVFYLNRLKKILPIWWPYMIIKTALNAFLFRIPVRITEILGFAFFTGYWQGMDHQGNWFIYTIMLFYLLSPLIFLVLYRSRKRTVVALLLVIFTAAFSMLFFCDDRLISFARLPVYIVGFYLASDQDRFPMSGKRWASALGIGAAGIIGIFILYKCFDAHLWDYGIWWYPYVILAPAFAVLISGLFHLISRKTDLIGKAFRYLGEASLEILLTSDLSYTYLSDLGRRYLNRDLLSLILLAFSVFAGCFFHFLIEKIRQRNVHSI